MVNAEATTERRSRDRAPAAHAEGLGAAKLNPFGDLHTLQHLSARFARALRGVFEPLLRQEVRAWAEPLVVQRFADYRSERGDALTGWMPFGMVPAAAGAQALCVLDGRFVLEMLDLFFGGTGAAPAELPAEFSPAAEALAGRIGAVLATPLRAAWEPLTRIEFSPGRCESSAAMLPIDGDDAMIVTRFGIAAGDGSPVFLDILYPVVGLKPHGATLTGKVLDKAEADPAWRTALTRSVMNVRFPVRSVLAEPVVPLSLLVNLKPGDVIPISIGGDVPVMVGRDRLGTGTVGTSNGFAAVRLTAIAQIDDEGLSA
ncbi:flagellar motor switch protein FliM [Sphingomonas jinjuensis]|uniref:Flagellar motor switch protein FliM n=1 Tax=Sphingomonas jinjuensis TaxID=535907 RepID=A0A840F3F2_9SPHN|nr:flagellar motor switch protein FliM [Sphingomonas jinjuensis]MBB4152339.1 flagellar motor switch protein FliM [Sphingomonas jinjuensis]